VLSLPEIAARAVIAAPVLPALAVVAIGGYALLVRNPRETTTANITLAALMGSLIASLLGAGAILARGGEPIHVPLGAWFEVGGYSFHTSLHLDTTSATMLVLTTVITSLVARFSRSYLHREAGFTRFFLLLGVFAAGMQLLVAAGTFDILFAGWELVGLSSVLLVAFFHDRTAPVRASLRVFVVYRLCDLGLLVGAALLHRAGHGSEIGDLHFEQVAPATATAISLAFLFAAMASRRSSRSAAGCRARWKDRRHRARSSTALSRCTRACSSCCARHRSSRVHRSPARRSSSSVR